MKEDLLKAYDSLSLPFPMCGSVISMMTSLGRRILLILLIINFNFIIIVVIGSLVIVIGVN